MTRRIVHVALALLAALTVAGCRTGLEERAARPTPAAREDTALDRTAGQPREDDRQPGDPAGDGNTPSAGREEPADSGRDTPNADGAPPDDGTDPNPAIPLPDGRQALGVPAQQSGALSVPDLVDRASGAVVEVVVSTRQGTGTGTGFIIDANSNIVTNNHVVEGAQDGGIVVVLSGNRIERAELVGRDPLSDLAVIRIGPKNLPILPLADSNRLRVGETVVAIGNALGLTGGPTVTTGVISALKRSESEPFGDPRSAADDVQLYDLIQTDTAINPGNSGGPLMNLRGEVVGVNTLGQRLTQSGVPVQGINYAVSANTARDVSQDIIRSRDGRATYPYLGIGAEFYSTRAAIAGRDLSYTPGQIVRRVEPGTPADEAGLRVGDLIVAIDGQPVPDESTFTILLRQKNPGDNVRLTVMRGERRIETEATLAELDLRQYFESQSGP